IFPSWPASIWAISSDRPLNKRCAELLVTRHERPNSLGSPAHSCIAAFGSTGCTTYRQVHRSRSVRCCGRHGGRQGDRASTLRCVGALSPALVSLSLNHIISALLRRLVLECLHRTVRNWAADLSTSSTHALNHTSRHQEARTSHMPGT